MPKQASSPKKHRLTLAQLTAYDDILTDALVDHVYFWTTIRKNKNAYHSSRGITEEAVTNILQKRVIVEEDPARAEAELLALPGLKKFSANLKTDSEKNDFRAHLRKYVNIYLADCPFEVATTNRYTVVTQEAAVTARRYIKKGETVKYLCGVQVHMTEEEEELIKTSRRDFSIVVSGRSGTASLFLGPARFANHDCDANARLKPTGSNGMEIVAYKNIDEGEEVTVCYGENYFGDDNCECLCKTCERLCRNGWTAAEGDEATTDPKPSIESVNGGLSYSLRRRRKTRQGSTSSSREASMTPDINIRPHVPKKTPRSLRFKHADSPLGKSPSLEPSSMQNTTPTPSKRRFEKELEGLNPTPSKKRAKTGLNTEVKVEDPNLSFSESIGEDVPSSATPSSASPSPSSAENQTATDATSVDDEDTIVVEPRVVSHAILKIGKTRGTKTAGLMEQADAGETLLVDSSTSADHPAVIDEATAILAGLDADKSKAKGTPSKYGEKQKKRKRKEYIPLVDKDHAPTVRVPGDYVLTPALLAEPASSWIVCKICEEPFVQKDAYFTRSSCPRCERHSKLYGYGWPKTDKENSEDDEERVLDHRTIHRFIRPSEERTIRKLAKDPSESRAVTRDASEVLKNGKRKAKDDNEGEEGNGGRRGRKRARRN